MIRAMGVRLVIDDFGQAQASLSLLQRFAIDEVKIDAALVSGCTEQAGSRQLIAAIVSMAHALGIVVTAKGVETSAQAELLRHIGCDRLQGHFLCAPLGAETLLARMGERRLQPLGELDDFSV